MGGGGPYMPIWSVMCFHGSGLFSFSMLERSDSRMVMILRSPHRQRAQAACTAICPSLPVLAVTLEQFALEQAAWEQRDKRNAV